jgi:hypothetical protein
MTSVNRALFLTGLLPLLASCDAMSSGRSARKTCEAGAALIRAAEATLAQPTLTPQECSRVRSDLSEGLVQIRVGLAYQSTKTWFFDPADYAPLARRAEKLLGDPRLTPQPNGR